MREIKFRAWNKKKKQILRVQTIFMLYPKGIGLLCEGKNALDEGEYELMQYTGLKVNGKEIYEGNIVEFKQHATYEKIKADIAFIHYGFTAHYYKSKSIEVWINLPLNEEDQGTMKVIGNIYENPELLKT